MRFALIQLRILNRPATKPKPPPTLPSPHVFPGIKLRIIEMNLLANQNVKICLQSAPAEHSYRISSAPRCTTSSSKEREVKSPIADSQGLQHFKLLAWNAQEPTGNNNHSSGLM